MLSLRHRRSAVLGIVIATALSATTSASHVAPEHTAAASELPDTPDLVGEAHLYCMTLAVYFEGGSTGESEQGQRHIARVVHERAKAGLRKWGGSDVCDVVFYRKAGVCQFSFACLPAARRTARRGAAWELSEAIAREELTGQSALNERLIRYYMNPALTPDRNACRFRKEFVQVTEAGRHQFFREPTTAELADLRGANPDECRRHAAALQAQAQKAKAKKAKSKVAKAKRHLLSAKHKSRAKKVRYAKG